MRQALADAVLAVAAAAEHDDGCMVYEFSVDLLDAEMIRNVEVWRDQKALDEHMTHDHTITGRDARPRALGVLDSSSR